MKTENLPISPKSLGSTEAFKFHLETNKEGQNV
jgi:hypothetical protein